MQWLSLHLDTNTHTDTHTDTQTCTYTHTQTHTHIYKHTHTQTHTQTHTHIYTHIQGRSQPCAHGASAPPFRSVWAKFMVKFITDKTVQKRAFLMLVLKFSHCRPAGPVVTVSGIVCVCVCVCVCGQPYLQNYPPQTPSVIYFRNPWVQGYILK